MLYCGGDIQFCDVDPKTGLICPESLQSTIRNQNQNNSKAQRFIAPVSLSGATPPLDICSEIAKRFDYKLIEDASHSIISYSVNSSGDKIFSASCKYTESACLSFSSREATMLRRRWCCTNELKKSCRQDYKNALTWNDTAQLAQSPYPMVL